MNNEIDNELSRIQSLSRKYRSKLKMCPLEIKKEEIRAFYIDSYINGLLYQLSTKTEIIKQAINYIKSNIVNDDNGCGDYWRAIYDGNIDKLLEILESGKNEK